MFSTSAVICTGVTLLQCFNTVSEYHHQISKYINTARSIEQSARSLYALVTSVGSSVISTVIAPTYYAIGALVNGCTTNEYRDYWSAKNIDPQLTPISKRLEERILKRLGEEDLSKGMSIRLTINGQQSPWSTSVKVKEQLQYYLSDQLSSQPIGTNYKVELTCNTLTEMGASISKRVEFTRATSATTTFFNELELPTEELGYGAVCKVVAEFMSCFLASQSGKGAPLPVDNSIHIQW